MSMSSRGKLARLPRRLRRNLLYHILETSAPAPPKRGQRRSKEDASSAVVAKVAMEDKEGSVLGSSSSSAALPAVEHIIEESHEYKATLGNGFSLHTPMVSLALARLGATDADIESHHAYAMGKNARYELVPIEEEGEPSTSASTVVVTDENWLSLCNMGGLHEVSFRRYWRGEIARSGRAASVSKLLSRFTDAVHSRLHHGAIRLAYAVEMRTQQEKKKDEEIAVALAAFCANHSRLRWTQQEEGEETTKGRSATSMSEGFQQMRRAVRDQEVPLDQKMGFAKKYGAFMSDPLYLRSVPALEPSGLLSSAEGLAEFVRHVVELYLCKPNILSLHMVTGLHALIVLKPYYTEEDFEKALRTHWTSTGVLYLSMKAPPLEKAPSASTSTGRMVSWDALAAHAIGSRADHDIKFVDTCLFLHGAFPGHADLIQRAASTLVRGKGK